MEFFQKLAETAGNQLPQVKGLGVFGLILTIVIAALFCFFGYRGLKFFIALCGFGIGALIGAVIVLLAHIPSPAGIIVIIVIGAVCALIAFFIYRVGVFVTVAFSVGSLVARILSQKPGGWVAVLIAIIAGLLVGFLVLKFLRTGVILISAITGGFSLSLHLVADVVFRYLLKTETGQARLIAIAAAGILLSILGMVYQFRTAPDGSPRKRSR